MKSNSPPGPKHAFALCAILGPLLIVTASKAEPAESSSPSTPPAAPPIEDVAGSPSAAPEPVSPPSGTEGTADAPAPPPAPKPPRHETAPTSQALPKTTPVDPGLPNSEASGDPPGAAASRFARPPLEFSVGEGDRKLSLTFYGFLQADFIYDTTRSFHDALGTSLVARTDTYEGTVGRAQTSVRNTRLGLLFQSPRVGGMKPRAVFEGDFFGNQPGEPPAADEAGYYDSPTFRLRHAYVRLDSEIIDVLVGQTYDVFGWQNYFFPTTAEFIGLPNQVFSRHAQLRLSKSFGETGPVGVDLAAAVQRPAQRDAGVPDVNAGLRLKVNGFRGLRASGNGATQALPLALGVSGMVRQYDVDAFTPPPTQDSNSVTAWGLSVDALLPVLAAANANDRSNRLTLTGAFVTGTGIGDLMTVTGGATFPTLPNPAQANPPPEYEGNIDAGLVSFDTQGVLHTIDWQAFRVGLVYYLPPTGRLIFSANYTQAYSKNMRDLFPRGGAEIELLTRVADRSRYVDANLFFDATPALRFGISGSYMVVKYIDGDEPHNWRGRAQAMYFF